MLLLGAMTGGKTIISCQGLSECDVQVLFSVCGSRSWIVGGVFTFLPCRPLFPGSPSFPSGPWNTQYDHIVRSHHIYIHTNIHTYIHTYICLHGCLRRTFLWAFSASHKLCEQAGFQQVHWEKKSWISVSDPQTKQKTLHHAFHILTTWDQDNNGLQRKTVFSYNKQFVVKK